jgi:DNA repair protein RecN (Recombination protein N)
MLTTLRIKKLALVEDLTWELQPGLNIISGETGAGKSILIGALNLVLGERADRTLIRGGADACSVEAVFDGSQVNDLLAEHGLEPCENGQLILKRTFSAAGTNRQFVNGSPTTLGVLARVGESLVDIHGPHEHQSLLHPAKQLAILDAFGDLQKLRAEFADLVRRHTELQAAKTALIVDERTYAQQLDLLRFQVQEITAAKLKPDEEVTVEQEYQRASNAAKLMELAQTGLATLSGAEQSLLDQVGVLGRTLQELQRTDPSAASLLAQHEQAVGLLHDLQSDLSHYVERLEIDPARLQELEARLNLIHSLKRKYGDVVAFGEEAARKLQALEQRDAELERLNAALASTEAEIQRTGKQLARERQKIIPQLARAVTKQLGALGFKQSQFDVAISTSEREFTATGLDTIEFQFAPNPGEPARPLRVIASSGELARVMLALKTVLATVDEIPVLVFDEVDANVGGETASAVGEKMRQIARSRQVLCITHLPQVAAQATAHYAVTKDTRAGRTVSQIQLLEGKERVTELARMLGGQTDAARKHAAALLQSREG